MSDDLIERLRDDSGDWLTDLAADRIEELEAKLAKAVEALEVYAYPCEAGPSGCLYEGNMCCNTARVTLAELKGQDDE